MPSTTGSPQELPPRSRPEPSSRTPSTPAQGAYLFDLTIPTTYLLMACGNFASLLMARATGRVHEIGVRPALGTRTVAPGSAHVDPLNAAVNRGRRAGYASELRAVMATLNPDDILRFDETTLDDRVLLFGPAVSLGSGLVAGIYPAQSVDQPVL